ncbi:hypothetical protein NNN64_23085, partial [Citrobacter sp. Igbk 14]
PRSRASSLRAAPPRTVVVVVVDSLTPQNLALPRFAGAGRDNTQWPRPRVSQSWRKINPPMTTFSIRTRVAIEFDITWEAEKACTDIA